MKLELTTITMSFTNPESINAIAPPCLIITAMIKFKQKAQSELASSSRHVFIAAVSIAVVNSAASMHVNAIIIIGEMKIK